MDSDASRPHRSAETSVPFLLHLMKFKYRETVLKDLARHGVVPRDDTPPEFVHQFVTDLHLFEIRRLKSQMLAGKIRKSDYATTVEALRRRYPILSLPVRLWIETEQCDRDECD